MVAFTVRITQRTGKHPFPQPFTAFAALDKEAADKLMSGRLSCHPLHDYGLWGDVDGRDGGGGAPSRFGFDPLEAATKCYETERGTVVNVDCGDARLFKAIRLHSLGVDSAGGGWNTPDPRVAELGDTALVILDMHEFVNRVAQALYAQFGYNCILLADKVEYFDPAKPQPLKCMFSKDRRFEWQQEFRILFCEATDRGPIEGMSIKSARRPPSVDLEIGGIGDIVQTIPIKDLVEGRPPSSTQFIPAMFSSGSLTGFEFLVSETRLEIASLITREVPSFVIDASSGEMRSYTDVFGEDSAFVEGWQFAISQGQPTHQT